MTITYITLIFVFILRAVAGSDLLKFTDEDLAAYLATSPLQVRKLRTEINNLVPAPVQNPIPPQNAPVLVEGAEIPVRV